MKSYGIFSPILGLRKDIPSILLKEAYTPDSEDVFWQDGEVHRLKKRLLEFAYQFPDKILNAEYYFKDTTSDWWFLIFTKRDIAYRDITNDRFIFINKIYNDGVVSACQENSGGTFTLTFTLSTGEDLQTEVKIGDFIRLDDKTAPYASDDTWYEVESVDAADEITVIGTPPTGFPSTGGSDYAIRKTFSGSDFAYWSVIQFHEKLLATNRGADNIIIWEGADQVVDLSCAYKATFLYKYNERVLLIRTIEGGTEFPFRIRWSGLADEADWGGSGSDSGAMEVNEGMGILQGCSSYKGNLLILKDGGIVRAWNVESVLVFNKKLVIDGIGTNAPDSILEMEDGTYFYSSDNTFRFFNGLDAVVISSEIDAITKNINPNFEQYMQVTMIEELNQILWAIPYADSEVNDKILIYDLDFVNNNWGVEAMEVASLGYYETEAVYDWSSLSIFDSWADWWWPSWRHRMGLAAFPIDVAGDYTGKLYRMNASEKDAGEDYTGYQVFQTDLGDKARLGIFDRLLLIQAYVRQEASGVLNFYIKRDNEADWQLAGSISLVGTQEILIRELPVDYLAKSFLIKISAQNPFKFLGAILKYEEIGER